MAMPNFLRQDTSHTTTLGQVDDALVLALVAVAVLLRYQRKHQRNRTHRRRTLRMQMKACQKKLGGDDIVAGTPDPTPAPPPAKDLVDKLNFER